MPSKLYSPEHNDQLHQRFQTGHAETLESLAAALRKTLPADECRRLAGLITGEQEPMAIASPGGTSGTDPHEWRQIGCVINLDSHEFSAF